MFDPEKVERLEPSSGVDSVMRVIHFMVDIEDGGYVQYSDYEQLLALYRAAVPLPDPCVGDLCWFNQETGYRELCSKHETEAKQKLWENRAKAESQGTLYDDLAPTPKTGYEV